MVTDGITNVLLNAVFISAGTAPSLDTAAKATIISGELEVINTTVSPLTIPLSWSRAASLVDSADNC